MERMTGRVTLINPKGLYGFIQPTKGPQHHFYFHDLKEYGVIPAKALVSFVSVVKPQKKHPSAVDVKLIEELPIAA